ncbi:DASS family sodium-coupled anion symporter [Chromatiaceae bacterium AAb-1]|nr:DASS family sodium-coupled anion symporter [Chromatiaceae bacterium AAb-1]
MKQLTSGAALVAGPLIFIYTLVSTPLFEGMAQPAWIIAGLMIWMAIWWMTEVISIPATAMLPIVIIPLLGLDSAKAVTSAYADPVIFLFLGGFVISIAMERWNLHKRIALLAMLTVGSKPSQQLAGIMAVTAFLSMWMSNTATAVMMLPIGLSIIAMQQQNAQSDNFSKAILLSIAYAASIGGVATIIGTPPNILLAAYLKNTYNLEIGFGTWMLFGVPLAISMLILCWLWLTKFYKLNTIEATDSRKLYSSKLAELGKMHNAERVVLVIFGSAAFCWIFRSYLVQFTGLPFDDTIIAITAALLLFILPVGFKTSQKVLNWDDTKKLPWGVLLLFGGGLALAAQIQKSGLSDYIAQQVGMMGNVDILLLVIVVTTIIIFLTEITSNTATAATFLPLLGPVAVSLDTSAAMLVIPAAVAASFAFMLPVATPPNAIVFGAGKLKIADMAKAGLFLNLTGIVLIVAFTMLLARNLFHF